MEFKQYPSYKNSGVEWLGDVPENWDTKPTKFCFQLITEKAIENNNQVLLSVYTDIGVKPRSELEERGNKASTTDGYWIVRKGDIIVNKLLAWMGAIGLSNYSGVTSPAYDILRVKNKYLPEYYNYLFRNGDMFAEFKRYSRGLMDMRLRLYFSEFGNIKLPIPSIYEQNQIVSFLDTETARIDKLISKQQKLIELFKENIIALAMLEQIQGEGELVRLSHVVSEMYRPVHLNNVIEYIALGIYNRGRGLFHKPLTLGCDMGDSSFFYVNCGDLILSGQFAWEGAVAMATNAEEGCVVSHRYPVLRGKLISTEYLFALFMSDYGTYLLNDCSRGSAGRNRPLNTSMLLKQKVRIPSDKTQQEIKKLLVEKARLEINVNKAIEKLKEYRSSIISHAVTGKIDVREWVA